MIVQWTGVNFYAGRRRRHHPLRVYFRPRRFLLAGGAISLGIDRLLVWGEAEAPDSGSCQKEEGIRKASETALRRADILFEGQ